MLYCDSHKVKMQREETKRGGITLSENPRSSHTTSIVSPNPFGLLKNKKQKPMMHLRAFVALCAVSAVVAQDPVDPVCTQNIEETREDITKTGDAIKAAAATCHNATQADCLAAVNAASLSSTFLVLQITRTGTACSKIDQQCANTINLAAFDMNTVVNTVTKAVADCSQGFTAECSTDIHDAATQLGQVGKDVSFAVGNCTATVNRARVAADPVDPVCTENIEETREDITKTGDAIKAAAATCHNATQADCLAAVNAASLSSTFLVLQITRTGTACSKIDQQCANTINLAAFDMNTVVNTVTKAVADCSQGFTAECSTDIHDAATQLGQVAQDVSSAVGNCTQA